MAALFVGLIVVGILTLSPRMRALAHSQRQERTRACLKYFEALVAIVVGGGRMQT